MPPYASILAVINKHHSMIDYNNFTGYIFMFCMKFHIIFVFRKVSSFKNSYILTNWVIWNKMQYFSALSLMSSMPSNILASIIATYHHEKTTRCESQEI